jgi:hypothetical protein
LEINETKILNFNGEYKLAKYPPKEDGYYMTIRCGLGGIYTCLNKWKDNAWQVEAADASNTIAYSKEQITIEQVDNWCKAKLEKYHKENEICR